MRYELTDYEWAAIKPMLPNEPRGIPRVNDRRVLNGILWVLLGRAFVIERDKLFQNLFVGQRLRPAIGFEYQGIELIVVLLEDEDQAFLLDAFVVVIQGSICL